MQIRGLFGLFPRQPILPPLHPTLSSNESIRTTPHPLQQPSFRFPVSSFMSPAPRRLVVGYVSFDSRLVVGWWSVTCRLVVDWWSVMCRFLQAPFGLTPCQSSPPSQNPPRNSITTTQDPPKPTTPSAAPRRLSVLAENGTGWSMKVHTAPRAGGVVFGYVSAAGEASTSSAFRRRGRLRNEKESK